MRTVFFGTPEWAVPSLEALLGSSHEMAAVVTAPDRPKGRGMVSSPSPVKDLASSRSVAVLQPGTLRDDEVVSRLAALDADAFVVVAFGLILPSQVLELPRAGCINVHFSLLPRLRGAAPVQWALIEGLTLTGVTIMKMDEGLDTGPIYSQVEEPISEEDTSATLGGRLADRGATLLVEVLDMIEKEQVQPHAQNAAMATAAPKIKPEDARIDWTMQAANIRNRVRAFNPRPGAWTVLKGKRVKLWRIEESPDLSTAQPGTIDVPSPDLLFVDTGSYRVSLEEVQPEGSRIMSASEFIRGYRPQSGERFE